jgi:FG-GAP repeat protein
MKRSLAFLVLSTALIRGEAAASPINTQIGFAVSMDGGWLAVGSPRDDEKGKDAGAVLLFQQVFLCWVLQQTITASDAQPGALFGSSVSLRNGVLAVAAAGAEAVYTSNLLPDATWSQPALLPVTDGSSSRRFGQSLATDGGWLAVGDLDPYGREPGVVHMFQGPAWNEVPALAAKDPVARERFGHAVSVRGNLLAVGAPGSAQTAGAVYVFHLQESGWEQQATLIAADGGAGDQLGYSVAASGDEKVIVAGAPTAGEGNEGAAYVFSVESGTWKEVQKLPGVKVGNLAGSSVAIDDKWIAVGAPLPFGARTGLALFYERGLAGWLLKQILSAPNGSPYDLHGFSVTLEGTLVAGGAPLNDQGGAASGAFYSQVCIEGPE